MFDHWKNFFHPHEGNDHHPYAYRTASAFALAGVVGVILLLSALQTGYIRQSDQFLSAVLPSVLTELTNKDRVERGLQPLDFNKKLARAAQMKANHMVEHKYFAHDSPSGVTPWVWFRKVGYDYRHAGENLAINFSDSKAVEAAWMNSRLHRRNILEPSFTEIGIATAKGQYKGRETIFVVQMFGRPSAAELAQRSHTNPVETSVDANAAVDGSSQEANTQTTPQPATAGKQSDQYTQPKQKSKGAHKAETGNPADTDKPTQEPTQLAVRTQQSSSSNQKVVDGPTKSATTAEIANKRKQTTYTPTFSQPMAVSQIRGGPNTSEIAGRQVGKFAKLLSQPQFLYTVAMFTLAGLIILALLVSIFVEIKKHHIKQAMLSVGALFVLLGVFYFGRELLFVDPVVAAASISTAAL